MSSSRRSRRRKPSRRNLAAGPALRGRKFLVEPLEARTPPSDTFAGLIGIAAAAGALDPWAGSGREPLTAGLAMPQWSLGSSIKFSDRVREEFDLTSKLSIER